MDESSRATLPFPSSKGCKETKTFVIHAATANGSSPSANTFWDLCQFGATSGMVITHRKCLADVVEFFVDVPERAELNMGATSGLYRGCHFALRACYADIGIGISAVFVR